jgi:hypothetical protein
VDGPCEHGNKPSCSITFWEVLEQLAASQERLSSMKWVSYIFTYFSELCTQLHTLYLLKRSWRMHTSYRKRYNYYVYSYSVMNVGDSRELSVVL